MNFTINLLIVGMWLQLFVVVNSLYRLYKVVEDRGFHGVCVGICFIGLLNNLQDYFK